VLRKSADLSGEFVKKPLLKLMNIVDGPLCQDKLERASVTGRLDKKLGLDRIIIVGEDGGMYSLLSALAGVTWKIAGAKVCEGYLGDKYRGREKNKQGHDKIVIGKGSFGKVRFAFSTLEGASVPGDIIYVKKG
jgi:hypothetical protein